MIAGCARCCERQYRISGGMHGRAQRCRPPSPLEKAARKAAKHVLHEQRRLLMPPSRYHTSARKGSRDLKHYEEIKKSDDDGALESVLHLEASDFGRLPPDRHSVAPKIPNSSSSLLFLSFSRGNAFYEKALDRRVCRLSSIAPRKSRECALFLSPSSATRRRKTGTVLRYTRYFCIKRRSKKETTARKAQIGSSANSLAERSILQRSTFKLHSCAPLTLRSVASAVSRLSSCLSSFFSSFSVIRISRLRSCDRSSGHSSWRWKYYSRCFSLNSFAQLGFVLLRSDTSQHCFA